MKETRFKQTEIGEIPEDWEVVTLEDLYTITSSKRVFQSEWQTLGIPFYRAREIALLSEHKEPKEKIYISNELYTKYTRDYGSISENDILITGVGTLGKVYVVKQNDKFYFKDGNIIWLIWNKKNDSAFIKFLYNTPMLINQVFGNANGSTVSTYTIKNAKETLIPLPPYGEQKNISCFLNKIDTLISSLEKLIEKKKDIKQGTMQQLLTGKKRLPGFAKSDKYKQTEIGEIPEDWEVTTLKELCSLITKQTGFDYSATIKPALITEKLDDCLPFIQNKDFEVNNVNFNTDFYIPKNIAINFPKIYLNEDVLLISISGKIGNVAHFHHTQDAFIGGAVGIARFYNSVNISFSMYYLLSKSGRQQIFANQKSGAQHNLTIADVRNLKIPLPNKEEQNAITKIFSTMDNEIEILNTKLEKYRSIKQGMMQQLLTGKIRLI